jgi:hypothetical protein
MLKVESLIFMQRNMTGVVCCMYQYILRRVWKKYYVTFSIFSINNQTSNSPEVKVPENFSECEEGEPRRNVHALKRPCAEMSMRWNVRALKRRCWTVWQPVPIEIEISISLKTPSFRDLEIESPEHTGLYGTDAVGVLDMYIPFVFCPIFRKPNLT